MVTPNYMSFVLGPFIYIMIHIKDGYFNAKIHLGGVGEVTYLPTLN